MTDQLPTNPYRTYYRGEPRTMMPPSSDEAGLDSKKTMLVMIVVVGCFAVLWPQLIYPMMINNANSHIKPGPVDRTTGCCHVISELDVDTIKIMSELCSTIIDQTGEKPPAPKELVSQCKKAVLETCGIDISAALQDRISLGHTARQILEEVRSLNGSLCLKYNFGVSPWKLGVPHRVNINLDVTNNVKQERPSHMRSGMVHPAFRERGRAIPESVESVSPRKTGPPPTIIEGQPGPIPGMRRAMGGAGHVVPPSKQSSYGFMGILMPIYTVGFLVFFCYTIMKLTFKKKPDTYVGVPLYPPCAPDEQFQKEVFEERPYFNKPNQDTSKIVVNAVAALLEEVNQQIETHRTKIPSQTSNSQAEMKPNGTVVKEEDKASVTVMGMETTASSESGKKWSRPDSPVLPHPHAAPLKEPSSPPQQIYLEGALPPQSQILVANSATEAQKDSEDDSPVVLAGKMTLSVISLDSEPGTDDSSNSGKKSETSDDDRRRSSGNTSEEFEKINASDLEEQINNIIEEAENIALGEDTRSTFEEEILELEIPKAPQISEKEGSSDILEEIKNQFNLEDDLLQVLRDNKELDGKVGLPVTDIIKEFLNNEENSLIQESLGDIEQHPDDTATEVVAPEKVLESNLDIKQEEGEEDTETKDDQQENNVRKMADLLLQGLLVEENDDGKSSDNVESEKNSSTIADPTSPLVSSEDITELGVEEQPMDDIDYDDDTESEDLDENEVRDVDGVNYEDRAVAERRVNGDGGDFSRNGIGNSENHISENQLEDEDEEDIEEIIEYVDNTDEEGEEIVEINGNERRHIDENGTN